MCIRDRHNPVCLKIFRGKVKWLPIKNFQDVRHNLISVLLVIISTALIFSLHITSQCLQPVENYPNIWRHVTSSCLELKRMTKEGQELDLCSTNWKFLIVIQDITILEVYSTPSILYYIICPLKSQISLLILCFTCCKGFLVLYGKTLNFWNTYIWSLVN